MIFFFKNMFVIYMYICVFVVFNVYKLEKLRKKKNRKKERNLIIGKKSIDCDHFHENVTK